MTRKYFGTDGIRGRVGETPITAEFFLKLGWAAGTVLTRNAKGKKRVLIERFVTGVGTNQHCRL